MNHQQPPPIASSSRLPPIQTRPHAFDDQAAAAAAAAALLQIKRSPSSAHPPLLPSIQDMHGPYPYQASDRDRSSHSPNMLPYLPALRADYQQYRSHPHPGTTPGYFTLPPPQAPSPPQSFHSFMYSNSPTNSPLPPPPHQPAYSPPSPIRKRKRSSASDHHPPPQVASVVKGKRRESELRIDVEGDGDAEMDMDGTGAGHQDVEAEGEVRCICGFDVDDGFTIQCEKCHVWQHAACFSIADIDAAPDVYHCERCEPRRVDHERARRIQADRLGLGSSGSSGLGVVGGGRGGRKKSRAPGSPKVERRRGGPGTGATRRRTSSAAQHPYPDGATRKTSGALAPGRRKDAKEPSPALHPPQTQSASHSHTPDPPPPVNEEPWTEQYVPITRDIVHPAVQPRLHDFAHAWRGVTAFSRGEAEEMSPITSCVPMPAQPHPNSELGHECDQHATALQPLPASQSHPLRPPTYTLHALRPIAKRAYVVPYTCAITPSRTYLREPTSQYAQLGVPKQGVHLVPPPLELCLDARGVGGEGRWVRSGCHPNAVLRPVVCGGKGKGTADEGAADEAGRADGEESEDGEPEVTFGVFALRDVKAEEEIVLGWEWDDRHVVHELPRLLKEGYGNGSFSLKRAMGEVLSTLFSTFTTCACGASAHDCAIAQMQTLTDLCADGEPEPELVSQHRTSHERQHDTTSTLNDRTASAGVPDLGPLIGATRGCRTTERGQGGREGVELLATSAPSVESVARAFRAADADGASTGKRVHFPGHASSAPELVVSPATSAASPRKSWKRRYSESHAGESSDENVEDASLRRLRKKTRAMPRVDSSPPPHLLEGDRGGDVVEGMEEEALPPKMRKNWIKETLRVLNEEGQELNGGEDEDESSEDGHVTQPEGMDVDGAADEADVPEAEPSLDAGVMDIPLKSPSTALAGLSLQISAFEALRPSSSSSAALSATPASPVTIISPSTPAHAISSPENVIPHPSSPRAKSKSPKTPSRSRSPTRSHTSERLSISPRPSPVAQSKPLHTAPAVTPLLPSSAANANPLPSSPHHALDVVSPAAPDAPLSLPAAADPVPSEDPPSLSHDSVSLSAIDTPVPVPAPVPKKPPVKRRTLADWKSRKEKEKVAQALLQPPPPPPPPPPPVTHAGDMPSTSPSMERGGDVSISTSGSIVPTDVQMDGIEGDTDPVPPITSAQDFSTRNAEYRVPSSLSFGDIEGKMEAVEFELSKLKESSLERPPRSSMHRSPAAFESPPSVSSRVLEHTSGSHPTPSFSPASERSSLAVQSPPKLWPRPLVEDGEIGSSHTDIVPRHTSSLPSSRPASRPPSQPSSRPPSRVSSRPPSRAHSRPPSRPRSPPTHPRSFHTQSPTPSVSRSSPSRPRGGPPSRPGSDFRPNPRTHPVPSGPRALRNGFHGPGSPGPSTPYFNRGHPRPTSSARGGFYSPSGPTDRETDRGWAARGRGRGGSSGGSYHGDRR